MVIVYNRQRLLCVALLLASSSVIASQENSLFTAAVTYCAPPEAILIQQFSIRYVEQTSSVVFNVTAASVQKGLNVTANILLNVYGMKPVNLTFDFCKITDGLCPLPTYNFSGSGTVPLPPSVDVHSHVPAIAYKIPDLEAYAQLTLTDIVTGQDVACVQSTLENGWSMRQARVAYTTAIVAGLALLSSLWHTSLSTNSHATHRFIDVVLLFQVIASTGLLDLNYSSAYSAFTLNFAWSLGLFSHSGAIQRAIDSMRHRTGGNLPDDALATIAFTNRKLSPYNNPQLASDAGNAVRRRSLHVLGSLQRRFLDTRSVADMPATVTPQQSNILPAGIPSYASATNIAVANVFMLVFFVVIIMLACMVLLSAAAYSVTRIVLTWKRRSVTQERQVNVMNRVRNVICAHFLACSLIVFTPIMTFALFQWTLKDSWLSALLSAILFLCSVTSVLFSSYLAFRHSRPPSSPESLYLPSNFFERMMPLYGRFIPREWYFCLVPLLSTGTKSSLIALGQTDGLAQLIGLFLVELATFAALAYFRPHITRSENILALFLGAVRLSAIGMMFAFVRSFGVKPIPRVAIGFVIAVVFSIAVITLFFAIVVNMLWGVRITWQLPRLLTELWRRPSAASGSVVVAESQFAEKKALDDSPTSGNQPTETADSSISKAETGNADAIMNSAPGHQAPELKSSEVDLEAGVSQANLKLEDDTMIPSID